jgi:proprotein convertase subtilisin/kexin type 5
MNGIHQCLTTCNAGYPDVPSSQCKSCNIFCTQCSGSLNTQCQACATNYFLMSSTTTCDSSCPIGYFGDSSLNLCVLCSSPCASCGSSITDCLSCQSSPQQTYLQPLAVHLCLTSCPNNYFPVPSPSNNCQKCPVQCTLCTGPSNTECSACSSGNYLQPAPFTTTCTSTCPLHYYANNTLHECAACDGFCLTCGSAATDCLSCKATPI